MKNAKKIWIALVIVAVAAAGIAARVLTTHDSAQYFTEKVDRGDVRDVVEATGTINAVINVQVGSQVSGTISKMYADFNSHVKKDQIIARIDPSLFEGALLQAKADLETAHASAAAAKANLAKARAAEAQARADYERTKPLASQGIVAQQQLDVSKANEDAAVAAISAAQAEYQQAVAQVSQKAAAVTVAQTNLDYTMIRAPIDGTVVNRMWTSAKRWQHRFKRRPSSPLLLILPRCRSTPRRTKAMWARYVRPAGDFQVDAFPKDSFMARSIRCG